MKKLLAVVALILWSGIAVAQHSHGAMKGPNSGPMQDVAGVHAELVVAGNVVTINLYDEANKPISAKGFSGSLLLVSGGARETVQLAVSGDAALKGEAKSPVATGTQVTLVLKNAAGKSGQVKF
jgi:nitrogen fixation protein FixH